MYCATKPSQAIVWVFSKAVRQSLGGKPEMRVWLTLIEGADVFAETPEGIQAAQPGQHRPQPSFLWGFRDKHAKPSDHRMLGRISST